MLQRAGVWRVDSRASAPVPKSEACVRGVSPPTAAATCGLGHGPKESGAAEATAALLGGYQQIGGLYYVPREPGRGAECPNLRCRNVSGHDVETTEACRRRATV